MSEANPGDKVCFSRRRLLNTHLEYQNLVFESSEALSVVSAFDELNLKEGPLQGIHACSELETHSSPYHDAQRGSL